MDLLYRECELIVFVSFALLLDALLSVFELTIKISEMYYALSVVPVFLPQSFQMLESYSDRVQLHALYPFDLKPETSRIVVCVVPVTQ